MEDWALKQTKQCTKCPWRVDTNPLDIPNDYSEEKHRGLISTIADPTKPLESASSKQLTAMACHETTNNYCLGWINHQCNEGNNIRLRMLMYTCTNANQIELVGDQQSNFESTLPGARQMDSLPIKDSENFQIKAYVISDDQQQRVDFDAIKWFKQASFFKLIEMIESGFRGDYAADEVAMYFERIHPEMDKFFAYIFAKYDLDETGFECVIDPDDATAWIEQQQI